MAIGNYPSRDPRGGGLLPDGDELASVDPTARHAGSAWTFSIRPRSARVALGQHRDHRVHPVGRCSDSADHPWRTANAFAASGRLLPSDAGGVAGPAWTVASASAGTASRHG